MFIKLNYLFDLSTSMSSSKQTLKYSTKPSFNTLIELLVIFSKFAFEAAFFRFFERYSN